MTSSVAWPAAIASAITGHRQSFSFAVLHFGDQNITAAVKPYNEGDAAEFDEFAKQAAEQVQRAYFPEVIRLLDRYYGHVDYSLTSLFSDEQRPFLRIARGHRPERGSGARYVPPHGVFSSIGIVVFDCLQDLEVAGMRFTHTV